MDKETKKWYLSKTVWINIISIIIAVCGYLIPIPALGPTLTVIVSVLNIVLRFITILPIG